MTRFLRSNRLKPQRFQIDIKFLLSLHPQRCVSKQDTGVSLGEMMSSPSFIRFQVFCETRTSYRALIKSVLHPNGARSKIKRNSQDSEQKEIDNDVEQGINKLTSSNSITKERRIILTYIMSVQTFSFMIERSELGSAFSKKLFDPSVAELNTTKIPQLKMPFCPALCWDVVILAQQWQNTHFFKVVDTELRRGRQGQILR